MKSSVRRSGEPSGAFCAGLLNDAVLLATASGGLAAFAVPELDIVVYAVKAPSASRASEKARTIFDEAARRNLHLALIELPTEFVQRYAPDGTWLDSLRPQGDPLGTFRDVLAVAHRGRRPRSTGASG